MTKIEPEIRLDESGRKTEIYKLPVEEDYLFTLLEDIFQNHWGDIVFGPIIEGGAFEFRCPREPKSISLFDGYLTVHFGGTHFHLCIGENRGSPKNPTPEALRKQRKTSRAEIFRRFDQRNEGVNSWGLELHNGHDEQLCTIFFGNPFITNEDQLADEPDWSKLKAWEAIGQRYLGRELDDADRSSRGFK